MEAERDHIRRCIKAIDKICGTPPRGWYTGRLSPRTKTLVLEVYQEMKIPLLWNSDSYADDVPYWLDLPGEGLPSQRSILMLPYSFDCNDCKFTQANGFGGPRDFEEHLKNAFDTLYEEGCEGMPKMMSVGLHCRLSGKPARIPPLKSFMEYIAQKEEVWIATRTEIAEHFRDVLPFEKTQSL